MFKKGMIDQKPLTQEEIDSLMESITGTHEIPKTTVIPKGYYKVRKLGQLDRHPRRTYWYIRNLVVKKLRNNGILSNLYTWIQWSEV